MIFLGPKYAKIRHHKFTVFVGRNTPATTLQDHHKYYTLSVYQNNALKTFDDNFIDMENAELKHGNVLVKRDQESAVQWVM